MSKRSDILNDIVSTLKGVSKVREVSTMFKTVDDVPVSRMRYLQVISDEDLRERLDSNKNMNCSWAIGIWGYAKNEDDIEDFIEDVRIALTADLTLGGNAITFYLSEIHTAVAGIIQECQVIYMKLEVVYRIKDGT